MPLRLQICTVLEIMHIKRQDTSFFSLKKNKTKNTFLAFLFPNLHFQCNYLPSSQNAYFIYSLQLHSDA